MKILIISNLYEPYARGGAEAVVKTVVKGFVARGHAVTVLTAAPNHSNFLKKVRMIGSEEKRENGVRVLRFFPANIYFVRDDFRYPSFVRFFWRIFDTFNFHSALVFARVLAREKPDVVMTHNLVGIGLLTPWIIRRAKIKHIHTLHDVQLIHPSGLLMWGEEGRAERSFMRRIYESVTKKLFGSPTVVISPSHWLLDFHISRRFFPKSKTSILPNPVEYYSSPSMGEDTGEGGESPSPNPSHQGRGIKLLYAGQLEPHKGVKWLLSVSLRGAQATKQSHDEIATAPLAPRDDTRIEFAGAGSLEKEIKKAAVERPEQIVFLGQLDRNALQKKFTEVDALIVPSLCYENAPQVISEALAAGLPVIASHIGGIPEMIRDGQNGFLFEPGNGEDFQRAVSELRGKNYQFSIFNYQLPQYLDTLEGLC